MPEGGSTALLLLAATLMMAFLGRRVGRVSEERQGRPLDANFPATGINVGVRLAGRSCRRLPLEVRLTAARVALSLQRESTVPDFFFQTSAEREFVADGFLRDVFEERIYFAAVGIQVLLRLHRQGAAAPRGSFDRHMS